MNRNMIKQNINDTIHYCIVSFIFNKKILPTQASRDIIKAKVGEINGKTEKI